MDQAIYPIPLPFAPRVATCGLAEYEAICQARLTIIHHHLHPPEIHPPRQYLRHHQHPHPPLPEPLDRLIPSGFTPARMHHLTPQPVEDERLVQLVGALDGLYEDERRVRELACRDEILQC